ncbi:MAG TPA: hypothetical protein VFN46_10005 [Acetobacteraceae bacterium]|nr:hypothetical protein [Acetobacteraceae bacterium]
MIPYRVYMLDSENHIRSAQDIECAGDEEALAVAAQLARGAGAEVWCEARMVCRLDPAAGAAEGAEGGGAAAG